jgi:uncharacterized repeat protein (TIGR01451 family)
VTDTVPGAIASTTWTCSPTAGAVCPAAVIPAGNLNQNVTLPVGATATFVLTGTVAGNTAAGPLANTASVIPLAGSGATDTNAGNNSATATVSVQVTGNLAVTVTPPLVTVTRGQTLPYVVAVTNSGPTTISAVLTTTNTGSITGLLRMWTCAATAASSCGGALGFGEINQTVTVAPGGNATFTYQPFLGKVVSATAAFGSTIVETATLASAPGYVDTNAGDNTSSVTSTVVARLNLTVTNTSTAANPQGNGNYSYTVRVTNTGADAAGGVALTNPVPAGVGFSSWTCAATGGGGAAANCGGPTSGSGAINRTINVPATTGSVTFTITASRITSPVTHGLVNSVATAAEPPNSNQAAVTGSPATAAVTFS